MKIASGSITTQNLAPAGEATAGSAVAVPSLNGEGLALIQVAGTYTGALTVQGRITESADWVSLPVTGVGSAASGDTIASAAVGAWRADISGFEFVRVTALAAVTGTALVWLRAADQAASASVGKVTVAP